MRLVIAGGGTGGHLFPGIAVAEALLDVDPASEVLFVGTERGIEARAVPKAGFDVRFIDVGGLKGLGLKKRLTTLAQLPGSLVQARRILQQFQADAVLGVGGYSSGPVLVAARTLGLPTAICEQNSVPGLTNRLLARLVDRIFVTFDASRGRFPAGKAELVGDPVRRSFRDAAARPAPAVERGLVFTFGGSQGARPLNDTAPAALALLRQRGREVRALHQAGRSDVAAVEQAYRQGNVAAEVTSFIDDMVTAYRRAHVVICRAGATSCAELTALGVAAILVPFPQAADDHQTLNARDLEKVGACVLLPQLELTPERLADEIERLIGDDARGDQLREHARRAGRLEAADTVARAALAGFVRGASARALLGAAGVHA